jgi:hypothetical protein
VHEGHQKEYCALSQKRFKYQEIASFEQNLSDWQQIADKTLVIHAHKT